MGVSYRKSYNRGPVRVNLSGSGVGVSVGVRGLRVGTGPRGAYVSASIPGTGLRYRQSLNGDRRSAGSGGSDRAKPWFRTDGSFPEADRELRRREREAKRAAQEEAKVAARNAAQAAKERAAVDCEKALDGKLARWAAAGTPPRVVVQESSRGVTVRWAVTSQGRRETHSQTFSASEVAERERLRDKRLRLLRRLPRNASQRAAIALVLAADFWEFKPYNPEAGPCAALVREVAAEEAAQEKARLRAAAEELKRAEAKAAAERKRVQADIAAQRMRDAQIAAEVEAEAEAERKRKHAEQLRHAAAWEDYYRRCRERSDRNLNRLLAFTLGFPTVMIAVIILLACLLR